MKLSATDNHAVSGDFVYLAGERFYAIRNVDRMAPFFVSVISNVDHWLFISSTGGLTAGRVSPETPLFPYVTVDKIHESTAHTGSKTLIRIGANGDQQDWEPFKAERSTRYSITRNLYKSVLGNKLCFEEINHDLQLLFRYTWLTSSSFGFIRRCEIQNLGAEDVRIEMVDGLQNILPAGTPAFTQTNSSNLVDAYKWTELDEKTGLALFTLYSAITDRAEPCESLKANTVFCLGLDGQKILLSSKQLNEFRVGAELRQEVHKRGIRGAYLVDLTLDLAPQESQQWQLVADIEQSQGQVVALRQKLAKPDDVAAEIQASIDEGSDELARIMACGDAFQAAAEEVVTVHHYANVLFNILRGGIFDDQYNVSATDFAKTIKHFNHDVYQRNRAVLDGLPEKSNFIELLSIVQQQNDRQLERLCYDYLPITFGRRHGDPSRPWNQFAIQLKDQHGERLLSYQGNWRDIFQNWEALSFSYPGFIENVIAKFVNASTVDGYNPYRVTKEGFDWEVEEPDNPWSYIGYWGDHQIIYLQKLLELSNHFHPQKLGELLYEPIFCYANVPYRIKPFEQLLANPKDTVTFDDDLAARIEDRVVHIGADGKLILDSDGNVYQVNLIEKLLVSLLSKLANLVIDGGIWLNTQRPEWNDANNALVGQGLSMVTLYYMRRYVSFLQQLLAPQSRSVTLSRDVNQWLEKTAAALRDVRPALGDTAISPELRFSTLAALGQAASAYREVVYRQESFGATEERPVEEIMALLEDALAAIDHSIGVNRRPDGLYHAYNLLELQPNAINIETLYPMLEGQVAALSAGAIPSDEAVALLEALFDSDVYRADQDSFMLYPDRELPSFLEKNTIPREKVDSIPLLVEMLDDKDERIVVQDADGRFRFNAELSNVGDLNEQLHRVQATKGDAVALAREPLQRLYETVFNHQSFTGRSGGMFGFEGLGCIYWHMVSKLLLAVQENYFAAVDHGDDPATCQHLGELYYRVRHGIGFNKGPAEFGAFPTDPYSHTPKHAGASQPGMTGQVKEEVLTRFGELGVRVRNGEAHFEPALLREREFTVANRDFWFLNIDGDWQNLPMPESAVAFTWCQVPVMYLLSDDADPSLTITWDDKTTTTRQELMLSANDSAEVFNRSGRVRQLLLTIHRDQLFGE